MGSNTHYLVSVPLVLASLIAAPIAGQTSNFRATRDLPGFREAEESDHSHLYSFAQFRSASGKALSAAEVTVLKERWTKEEARIKAMVADLATRPEIRYLIDHTRKISKHQFFSKVDFERHHDDRGPYLFYIEKPGGAESGFARRVASKSIAYLKELEQIFIREYFEPLGLTRSTDRLYAISVLKSQGSYKDFSDAVGSRGLWDRARAHYEPDLELVVTYEDSFRTGAGKNRLAVLHEFIHSLQHAYSKTGRMPKPIWFNEGLAEYRSECSNIATSLRKPRLNWQRFVWFYVYANLPRAAHFVSSVDELVACNGPGYKSVIESAARRAGIKMENVDEKFFRLAMSVFYGQSTAFVHFLHEGENGKYRAAFMRYFKAIMNGSSGLAPFKRAFKGVDRKVLQKEFLGWVNDEHSKRKGSMPQVQVTRPGAAGNGADPVNVTSYDAESLLPKGGDWKARLGAAIALAGAGRWTDSLAEIDQLTTEAPKTAKQQIEAERSQIEAVLQFRGRFLELVKRNKWRIRFAHGGLKHAVRIEEITTTEVVCSKGRKTVRFKITDFVPRVIFEAAHNRKYFDEHDAAIGAYLMVLNQKSARDIEKFAKRRRGAIKGWSATKTTELRDAGRPFAALMALANLPEPKDRVSAEQWIVILKSLLAEHGTDPLVKRQRDALRANTEHVMGLTFDPTDPKSLGINGKIESLGKDRIRISFRFEHGDAKDFVSDDDYLPALRKGLPALANPRASLVMSKGVMKVTGKMCFAFPVPLEAPLRISFKKTVYGDGFSFIGFCDDGKESFIAVTTGASIMLQDYGLNPPLMDSIESNTAIFTKKNHHFEVIHNGTKVTVLLDGKAITTAANIGTRTGGRFILFNHSSNLTEYRDFVIEGKLGGTQLEAAKQQWVGKQLKQVFGK